MWLYFFNADDDGRLMNRLYIYISKITGNMYGLLFKLYAIFKRANMNLIL